MTRQDLARNRGSGQGGRAGHGARVSHRRRRVRLRVGGLVVVLVAVAVGASVALSHHTSSPPAPACTVASTTPGAPFTLSPDQAQNASIIAAVAYARSLPDHAVTVALATALQESELANLPYGDRDSVGLFQQRPSQGWGTRAQLLDPAYAASAFYARLVKVPGWTSMAVTQAAQAVQQSAAPSAYAQWEDEARALAVAFTGEAPTGFTCRFASFSGAVPAPGALQQAMTEEMGSYLAGVTVDTKTGWATASWIVAHAYSYHVGQVSFGGWTWRSSTGKWTRGSSAAAADVVTFR